MTATFYFVPASHAEDDIAFRLGVPFLSYNNKRPLRKMTCHYCSAKATTRDHIVPQSKNGRDAWWNLVPACRPCNQKKQSFDTTCTCQYCDRAKFLMKHWLEFGSLP